MSSYYIDTCALKWRYLNGAATNEVNGIIDSPQNQVFTSELTMLEWTSALACCVRENQIDLETFKLNEIALMTDIAFDRLRLTPLYRTIERARYLIEYVGAVKKLGLRTGDSIQLVTAIELISARREAFTFVTSDKQLANIVRNTDVFRPNLTAYYLAP